MDESANTPEHDRPDGTTSATGPTGAARAGAGDDRRPSSATGGGHEVEDDAPDPHLDPAVGAQVTALLAGTADPGPMPEAVSDRIEAALLEAARLRVDPGPLAAAGSAGGPAGDTPEAGGSVIPLPTRAERPKPIYIAAAVAAAAVVVAAGASALHVTKRPNGAAIVGDTTSSTAATPSGGATGSGLHIQLSTTAYDADNLARRARALLDRPGTPLTDLAAESPAIGPIGTPIGLEACLEEIGALDASSPAPEAVSADLATYDGRPAVVVVVTRGGASTAWAVERSCTTGAPGLLKDATPVP